jgi:hypothetical protein
VKNRPIPIESRSGASDMATPEYVCVRKLKSDENSPHH